MQLKTKTTVWVVTVSGLALAIALWDSGSLSTDTSSGVGKAFHERTSGIMVESQGRVKALLRDDRRGARHQRFIVELDSGITVLVSHNIDLAPRVMELNRGDRVSFRGMYEWNDRGGVIHWTHADPDRKKPGGWIDHAGRRYR